MDASCSAIHNVSSLLDAIPRSSGADGALTESLAPEDLEILKNSLSFRLPFVAAFAEEVATCFHRKVFISAVAGKMLQLAVRILTRFECLVGQLLGIETPTFTLSQLQRLNEARADATRPRATAKELILLVDDLRAMVEWLLGPFCAGAESTVAQFTFPTNPAESMTQIRRCLRLQADKLAKLRMKVWAETCRLLAMECKENSLGIKGVASKYRMTNKPAPSTPSPYVELIFKPLR